MVERLCAPPSQRLVARKRNAPSSGLAVMASSVPYMTAVSTPLRTGLGWVVGVGVMAQHRGHRPFPRSSSRPIGWCGQPPFAADRPLGASATVMDTVDVRLLGSFAVTVDGEVHD